MHHYRDQDHEHCDVDEAVVQASHKSQHENKACWLKTFTLGGVDRVAENYNHCVEKEQVGEVAGQAGQKLVDYDAEQRK